MLHKNTKTKYLTSLPLLYIIVGFVVPCFVVCIGILAFSLPELLMSENSIVNHIILTKLDIFSFTNPILIAASVSVLTVFFSFYIASYTHFCSNRILHLCLILLALSYLLNPSLQYLMFSDLLGQTGIITSIVTMVYRYIPYSYFLLLPTLQGLDKIELETYLDLGAKRNYIFPRIIFQRSYKRLIIASILVFVLALGNVSGVYYSNISYPHFIVDIFGSLLFENTFPLLLIEPLFLLTILFAVLYYLFSKEHIIAPSLNARRPHYVCVRLSKHPQVVIVTFAVFGIYTLMLLNSLYVSFTDGQQQLTLENYLHLFENPYFWKMWKQQFTASVIGATIATILSAIFVISKKQYIRFGSHDTSYEKLLFIPLFVSEVIFAIVYGYMFTYWNSYSNIVYILGLSIMMLFIANIFLYVRMMNVDIVQFIEASHNLGANRWNTFWKIYIPTILPMCLQCFFVMLVIGLNESILQLILNTHYIPQLLQQSGVRNAFFIFLLLLSLLLLYIANLSESHNKKRTILTKSSIILIFVVTIFLILNS